MYKVFITTFAPDVTQHGTHQQNRKPYEEHNPEGKLNAGPPLRSHQLKSICEVRGYIHLQLTSDFSGNVDEILQDLELRWYLHGSTIVQMGDDGRELRMQNTLLSPLPHQLRLPFFKRFGTLLQ